MEKRRDAETEQESCCCADSDRRRTVGLILATGVAAAVGAGRAAQADTDPAGMPPQAGDQLVQAGIEHKGEPIHAADVASGEKLLQAWAKDPATGTVRDKSRLNRILLVRLDPASLDDRTAKRAAEGGIVAYSDFCTHAGCLIENFRTAEGLIHCHCHDSTFDPKAGAKVVGGPAKRPLAALPVKIENGLVVVARPFEGKLGISVA